MKSKIILFLLIMSAGAAYGADEGKGGEGAVSGDAIAELTKIFDDRLANLFKDSENREVGYRVVLDMLRDPVVTGLASKLGEYDTLDAIPQSILALKNKHDLSEESLKVLYQLYGINSMFVSTLVGMSIRRQLNEDLDGALMTLSSKVDLGSIDSSGTHSLMGYFVGR